MKKHIKDFIRRGLVASGIGPLVLAALYGILHRQGVMETLRVEQVCLAIVSLWALAFVAGGLNVVYKIERLPLMVDILIHGGVLYVSYLATYLVNGWLDWGILPVLVFSGIFLLGYLVIWLVIFSLVKRSTDRVNESLKKRQMGAGEK